MSKIDLKNKIYNESCLETMSKMPDGYIDLTITSPPYDELRSYNNQAMGAAPEFDGYTFPFEKIAKELYRVTKKGGVVVWIVGDSCIEGNETGNSFRQALFLNNVDSICLIQ